MANCDAISTGFYAHHFLSPSHSLKSSIFLPSTLFADKTNVQSFHPSLKLQNHFSTVRSSDPPVSSTLKRNSAKGASSAPSGESYELADICWDDLGFRLVETDYMYITECSKGGDFSKAELKRFDNIELSVSAGGLDYGRGTFDTLKAYRKKDGSILLFRPKEHALRMRMMAEKLGMPSPTVEHFVEAVGLTVLANKRWVPPPGKGSLYIRTMLRGRGEPLSEYMFLIFVNPVGNYFKEGLAPVHLVVENEFHSISDTPSGAGGVKSTRHHAKILKAKSAAKLNGYADVLYLDSVHKKYLEEASSCNVFVVKGRTLSSPEIKGSIPPDVPRKSIIDFAQKQGFKIEERLVPVEELLDADEVFYTGTPPVVLPVSSVTYLGKRVSYGDGGVGAVTKQLYEALSNIQMGITEDPMGWTVELN